MTVSSFTIQDVKIAFNHGKNSLSMMDQLAGEWIYGVDPETMDEVKAIYAKADGNTSLYNVFCRILKLN